MADKPVAAVAAPAQRKNFLVTLVDAIFGLGTDPYTAVPAVFALVAVLVFGLVPTAMYAMVFADQNGLAIFGMAMLLGLTALLAGGLLGFLFGIPRQLQEARGADKTLVRGNTNLAQISDWLTKLLIGVGLTQVLQVPTQLQHLAEFLSPALGGVASSPVFALGLLGYFSISGFLIGYLSTTLLLGRAIEDAEKRAGG